MKVKINYATAKDKAYLSKNDIHIGNKIVVDHIGNKIVVEKIKRKEYIITKADNRPVGFLRFSYFWDLIPIINVIGVDKEYRDMGIGKQMVNFLEKISKKNKQKFIISSSTGNEKDPQTWHKKIGFKEIGALKQINYPSKIQEVFFIKKLGVKK